MNDNISPFVVQQLKQLYAGLVTSDGLAVHVVACSQQPNGCDCGVFAAAFLFQWALLGTDTNLDIKFDVSAMRNHLARCLETDCVIAFPAKRETRQRARRTTAAVQVRYV